MKKAIVLILFSVILFSCNKKEKQRNLIQKLYWNTEINWDYISINIPDSIKKAIINSNEELKTYLNSPLVEYDHFVFTDFNNDQNLDVIIYCPKVSSMEDMELVLLVNEDNSYKTLYKSGAKLLTLKRETPFAPYYFKLFSTVNSGFPYTESFIEIVLDSENGKVNVNQKKILLYENVQIPSKKEFYIPFTVENEKYKLRSSPEIIDGSMKYPEDYGNVIGEFTKGDIGYALADSTDNTGRIWWFVIMENNIDKDLSKFLHIDKNQPKQAKMRTFGWVSSRYVKRIYE